MPQPNAIGNRPTPPRPEVMLRPTGTDFVAPDFVAPDFVAPNFVAPNFVAPDFIAPDFIAQ